MQIGFIGLGAMGLPMARNLAANGRLTVYDIAPVVRDMAAAIEGIEAGGRRAAAAASDVPPVAQRCRRRGDLSGSGGHRGRHRTGRGHHDCSTVSPRITRTTTAWHRMRSPIWTPRCWARCPRPKRARSGSSSGATWRPSTAPPICSRPRPFHDLCRRVGRRQPDQTDPQTLVAANAVMVEAVALCLATDTDLDCFYDVVVGGGGFAQSRHFERRVPRCAKATSPPVHAGPDDKGRQARP